MKKTVPVAYYKDGERQVIGEATVDIEDYSGVNWVTTEININNAGLSEILAPRGEYSFAKSRRV